MHQQDLLTDLTQEQTPPFDPSQLSSSTNLDDQQNIDKESEAEKENEMEKESKVEKEGKAEQERKVEREGIIARSWSAIKKIIQDMSETAHYSFLTLTDSASSKQRGWCGNKKPSKMTLQLIRSIHRGFDPHELSASRWTFELEDQKRDQASHAEQLVQRQKQLTQSAHIVNKPKPNKVLRRFLINLQEAPPYNQTSQAQIQTRQAYNQRSQVYNQRSQGIAKESINRMSQSIEMMEIEHSLSGSQTNQQHSMSQPQPNKQPILKPVNPSPSLPTITLSQNAVPKAITAQEKGKNQNTVPIQSCVQQQAQVPAAEPQKQNQGEKIPAEVPKASQKDIQKEKPKQSHVAERNDKGDLVDDKSQNPFFKQPIKKLSLNDLIQNPNTSNLFQKNKTTQYTNKSFAQAHVEMGKGQPKLGIFADKNILQQPNNQDFTRHHNNHNSNTNFKIFSPASPNQPSTPFNPSQFAIPRPHVQPAPSNFFKKGLAPGQPTTFHLPAEIARNKRLSVHFAEQNVSGADSEGQRGGSRLGSEGQRVDFLSGLASKGQFSQQKVRQLFTNKQDTSKQASGLFNSLSQAQQHTEKKAQRPARKHKKEPRVI